ncbi:MFS transporter [Lysobacter antibioticus]|uniref:Transmembrane secretion effector family protein n=1 Tax=Lysobacter antibioticus TaxID=84531 RepID=A0A0S2FCV6_LYSAN|nr:MFS transporter [Lysobacter antibioticus]ALN81371.1 transmembrane secretion effector family protein [Lysobacter antibioticus]
MSERPAPLLGPPPHRPRSRFATAARLWRIGRREPRFGWLLLDNLITTFGASFTLIALPFLVMRLTGSAFDLGLTAAIEALPSVLFLFFFGGFLDRANPIRVLWICRALYVVINASMGLLTWFGLMTIEIIYTLALFGGLVWAVAYPAGRASFGLYIRKGLLPAGNAVFAVASSLAMMLLPMLAGSLILASSDGHGLAIAFWIDALSVVASLWLLAAVRRRGPVRRPAQTGDAADASLANATAAASTQAIPRSYYLYLLVSTVLVFGPVQILLPVLLVEHGDTRYFLVYVAQFAGIAAAASFAGRASTGLAEVIAKLLSCWAVAALAYGLLAWNASLPTVLAAFCLLAGASNFYGIQSLSWLQRSAAAQRMGREMTWFSAATMGAMPLATLSTGLLLERLRFAATSQWLMTLIALCLLAGIVHLRLRLVRVPALQTLRGPTAPGA